MRVMAADPESLLPGETLDAVATFAQGHFIGPLQLSTFDTKLPPPLHPTFHPLFG